MLGIVLGPPRGAGIAVVGVTPGSGAAAAGLQVGDVVVSVAGVPVDGSVPTLFKALSDAVAGDVIAVEYLRDSQQHSVDVTLNEPQPFAMPLPPPDMAALDGAFDVTMATTGGPNFVSINASRLQLHDLDATLGRYFGVDRGVLVLQADAASGLEGGDVVVRIGDAVEPNSLEALQHLARPGGQPVTVTVIRDGAERSVDFVPGAATLPALQDRGAVMFMRDVEIQSSDDD